MKKFLYFLPLILAVAGIFFALYKTRSRNISNADVPEAVTSQTFRTEVFVSNLVVPWSMAFINKDRLLVTERRGQIRIVEKGKLLDKPLLFLAIFTTRMKPD